MTILGNILSAIFGSGSATTATTSTAANPPPSASPSAPGGSVASQVDVEDVLAKMAAKNSEKLDWRRSIVDLMKLLNLDSSLGARKQLAQELHYSGDANDSASMNVWLHQQVMQKLAENGGKVPSDLKS